jgi:hypothetical protein
MTNMDSNHNASSSSPEIKQMIHQQVHVVGKLLKELKYCIENNKTFALALSTDINTTL